MNRVQLIGNVTEDAVLKDTATTKVINFTVATNRSWKTSEGEERSDVQYHRVVAWGKVAELLENMVKKGRRIFVEGRISYRKYTGPDGTERHTTDINLDDFIMLDNNYKNREQE